MTRLVITIVQYNVVTHYNVLVDPATSISFPKSMKMPENIKLSSPLTLVGVGVRTVSFLGIKVYSVGFYADLDNSNLQASPISEQATRPLLIVNQIPTSVSPEEKIKYIIRNSSCLIRIGPQYFPSFNLGF